jgi:hypothetical protein
MNDTATTEAPATKKGKKAEAVATAGVEPAAGIAATATKVATVINSITMKDGRIVDFPGKRRMQKTSWYDEATGDLKVQIDFVNGETIVHKLNPSLINKYALHGAEQKLGDETAGETDPDDMYLAVEELCTRLDAGEWTQKRESDGMAGTSVLIKALVEAYGKSVEQIKAFLKGKTGAQKNALRGSDKLKPIVARLEAEKAAKAPKVDAAAILSELDSI